MATLSNKNHKIILVFNPLKRLVAIYKSVSAAAISFKTPAQNICSATSGANISCCGYYFRKLSDKIEITLDDLGVLNLEEYDQMCGVKRTYYQTKDMSRGGVKYQTKEKKL